jgi:hypothetical protein
MLLFGGRIVDVLAYATNPAAGGMISGRSFVDLRTTRVTYKAEKVRRPDGH